MIQRKGTKPYKLTNAVLIGDYEEVDGLELRTLTKNDADKSTLSGLIIKAYEMKFADENFNAERYDKTAFDKFINDYYVAHSLNMPLTILHHDDLEHLAGRVLVMEVNSVGVYYVCYIPKSYPRYDDVRNKIKEGILQGLSKEGWATDFDFIYNEKGEFDHVQIHAMDITALSVISLPANALGFEKAQEVANALKFERKKTTISDYLKK